MHTHTDKASAATTTATHKTGSGSGLYAPAFQLTDNRASSIAQRQQQAQINRSPIVLQLKQLQDMANGIQRAPAPMIQRRLMTLEQLQAAKQDALQPDMDIPLDIIEGHFRTYQEHIAAHKWEDAHNTLEKIADEIEQLEQAEVWQEGEVKGRFFERLWTSAREEYEWIIGELGRTTPDTPQLLGTGVNGSVPLATRRVVKLTMNQAVVADLRQLSFYSDNFSSCSPVAMFNENTFDGGLFHFPGGGLSSNNQQDIADTRRRMQQMYNDVQPTHIWLNSRFRAPSAWDPFGQPSDVNPITDFLQNTLGYTGNLLLIPGLGGSYSLYLNAAAQPQAIMGNIPVNTGGSISAMQDRTPDERSALAKAWIGLPQATKYGRDDFSHLAY
ncbi:MAG: hypothetical protein SF053_17195 [Bacteroidia bacterium]|nr:hypothetical protein [Bacteroidia bacterium]